MRWHRHLYQRDQQRPSQGGPASYHAQYVHVHVFIGRGSHLRLTRGAGQPTRGGEQCVAPSEAIPQASLRSCAANLSG